MNNAIKSRNVLNLVRRRLHLVLFSRTAYRVTLILCAAAAVEVITQKLTGLLTEFSSPIYLGPVLGLGLLISWLIYRRPTLADAARQIDQRFATHDLYLNLVSLDGSVGEYQPLVVQRAEETAERVNPAQAVPLVWQNPLGRVLLAVAAVAGLFFIPVQLDPFGKVAQAAVEDKLEKTLEESMRDNKARLVQLKKKEENRGEESPEIKVALDQLKGNLKQMKPDQKRRNEAVLNEQQKALGEKWKDLSRRETAEFLRKADSGQRFGGTEEERLRKLTRQLQQGDASGLRQELEQMKQDLQRLMKEQDPVKRQEMAQQLKKKLKNMERLASETMSSKPLSAALKRAMQQLDAAQMKKLSELAEKALQDSLDVAQLELEELAQTAKDLKKLEEALKVLSQAKLLNKKGKLDGKECENCISMQDYAELYTLLMEQVSGSSEGLGNEGMGRGGVAPEDDTTKSSFTPEVSQSTLVPGKILLSLKTKGVSDSGEAKRAYREQINKLKEGYSEAIDLEQIPPGYVDRIKQYFDTLDESVLPAEASEAPAAAPPSDGSAPNSAAAEPSANDPASGSTEQPATPSP